MNENENYIADAIHSWVWSGFYDAAGVNDMLDDIMEEDVDEEEMRSLINQKFYEKKKQERTWPAITDCDRLDAAFEELTSLSIIAIHNAGYTMSDGLDDVSEIHSRMPQGSCRGYCFYHGQDVERAVNGHGLSLAFGDMKDTDEGKTEIANIIGKTLQAHGLSFEWDADTNTRMNIPGIHWQRKLKASHS